MLTVPEAQSRRAARLQVLRLQVLLAAVMLEGFAGVKPALLSSWPLRAQVIQITLLSAHLGAQLRHLLRTQMSE